MATRLVPSFCFVTPKKLEANPQKSIHGMTYIYLDSMFKKT